MVFNILIGESVDPATDSIAQDSDKRNMKRISKDHDRLCSTSFLSEPWGRAHRAFPSSGANSQRTMIICVASLLGGDLGHGHHQLLSPKTIKKKICNHIAAGITMWLHFWLKHVKKHKERRDTLGENKHEKEEQC